MKLKYHGYDSPRACLGFRKWFFRFWAFEGRGVQELGITICGLYLIWQRRQEEEPQ